MSAIAIIPARGGSRRIPGKNIRPFHGVPIIQYTVALALRSGLFRRIVVSTDDNEVIKAALATSVTNEVAGRVEMHKRSEARSQNEVGTQEVAMEVLADMKPLGKLMPGDFACVIYPTAGPLIDPLDFAKGLHLVNRDWDRAFAFAVGTEPLRDAGQFYWGQVEKFMNLHPLIHPASIMVPIPEDRVCDINTEEDWTRAERMYLALQR